MSQTGLAPICPELAVASRRPWVLEEPPDVEVSSQLDQALVEARRSAEEASKHCMEQCLEREFLAEWHHYSKRPEFAADWKHQLQDAVLVKLLDSRVVCCPVVEFVDWLVLPVPESCFE